MNFSGKPAEYNRFLGYLDIEDPTSVPTGLAAVCRNTDFTLTSAAERAGVNLAAGGVAAGIQAKYKTPITGLMGMIYQPENSQQSYFQMPLLFQDKQDHSTGSLQAEVNVGSGTTQEITGPLITLPAKSHMIGAQAYNNAFMAFSDLISPTGQCALLNLQEYKYTNPNLALWPYGMKPFGWSWIANSPMLANEVGTPTVKNVNGHIYQWSPTDPTKSTGTLGPTEPIWPLGTGDTVTDGTGFWTEMTPTGGMVYQCYPPSPTWTTTPSDGGSWPVGSDGSAQWIYFVFTYVTTTTGGITGGETDVLKAFVGLETPSGANYSGGPPETGAQSYTLNCPAPAASPAPGYTGTGLIPTGWNLYIALADNGGTGLPNPLSFYKQNTTPLAFGTPFTVRTQATSNGVAPVVNTANIIGAGNCDAAETVAGLTYIPGQGLSGSLYEFGIRYCGIMFVNQNGTVSGFTQQSTVPVKIYYNGSTLIMGSVPLGPEGTIARIVSFTELQFDNEANPNSLPQYPLGERWAPVSIGTSAGPYFYNGNFVAGPLYFVFPQTTLSDGYKESATVLGDNIATQGWFSFTDTYLIADNDVTDRLQVIWPYPCVDLFYSATTDRMIQTGVVGFNGHWVSVAADPESYYGADVSFIPTQNDDGERAICAREFRGVLYSLRERSGYVMIPNDAIPSGWDVQLRWDKVGPCGPRAVDTSGRHMIFVHRSGVYRYSQEEPEPVFISKELKYFWQTINWLAEQTIWVKIDEEKQVVRIGLPVGNSTVPNVELLLYYGEGWGLPIHFSTYKGSEISMDQARRYSIQDVAANLGLRIERAITPAGPFDQGEEGIVQLDSSFYTSQFMYGSSAPDGACPSITPGIWHDGESANGNPPTGIEWVYETVCPQMMMILCKFEGFNLNARGQGSIQCEAIAGRAMITDWNPDGTPAQRDNFIKLRDIDLVPNQSIGISRWGPAKINERWRLRFSNGGVPDVWAELKYLCLYSIPWSSARTESQT